MKLHLLIICIVLTYSCTRGETDKTDKNEKIELDLSTDENVIREVQKYRDTILDPFTPENVCIIRPPEFNDLILFAGKYDGRCVSGEIFYKNMRFTDHSFAKALLNDHGWKDESKREQLILDWMRVISARWEVVMQESDTFFDTTVRVTFHAPTFDHNQAENKYEATGWIERPASEPAVKSYYRIYMVFDEDGNYIHSKYTDEINIYKWELEEKTK